MALMSCPDCGRQISDSAPACIHCGRPSAHQTKSLSQPEVSNREARREGGIQVGLRACGRCGSEDVRKLGVIHQAGLATKHSTSTFSGAGFDSNGDVAFGGGSAETWTESQTALSKRAAPPQRKSGAGDIGMGAGCLSGCAIVAIVGMIGGGAAVGGGLLLWLGFAGVIGVAVGMLQKERNDEWNRREWPKLNKKWQESVMCLRCGEITSQ